MSKKRTPAQIFEELERVANILPSPIYWLDVNGINLGLNDLACIRLGGLDVRDSIVGKDHSSYYPKDVAETLMENNRKVVTLGKTIEFEEKVVNIKTKAIQYFASIRSPLWDDEGNIIGIIGTSIEITDKKEAEELKVENEKQKAKIEVQEEFITVINEINHVLQKHKFNILNRNLGIDKKISQSDASEGIHLTNREQEVLYYLSLNKSPKEIAKIFSIIDNKDVSFKTVQSIIDKQLYIKFGVFSTGQLIQEAHFHNLIPFLLQKKTV